MYRYYHDPIDDSYLAVNFDTADYYHRIGQPRIREARATCLAGDPMSICTTGLSIDWLAENCTPVRKADVPAEWLVRL